MRIPDIVRFWPIDGIRTISGPLSVYEEDNECRNKLQIVQKTVVTKYQARYIQSQSWWWRSEISLKTVTSVFLFFLHCGQWGMEREHFTMAHHCFFLHEKQPPHHSSLFILHHILLLYI